MNTEQEKLIIRYAVDEIVSSCDDNEAFWERLLKCESQEDFEIICDDLNVEIWQPFEYDSHDRLISHIDDKISCFKYFASAYEKLKDK